jgi:hypothetical protein
LTTPGKPTETRSKPANCDRNVSSARNTALGVGTAGVTIRSLALMGLPRALSSMALIPDPPMSMESVTGAELARETGLATFGAAVAVVAACGLIRTALY